MKRQDDTTERQGRIRELASRIAKERIAPNAAEYDHGGSFPLEAIRSLGEAGLSELIISEAEGGIGEGRSCFASVVREIARACASAALIYTSHVVAAKAIEVGGSELLKGK